MDMYRKLTLAFAVIFAIVVTLGYIPAFNTPAGSNGEHLMFNLFVISLIDDITHSVTALVAIVAGLHSEKASVLFLTAFGWYYALDAAFFLTYGFFNDKPWYGDLMLNAPHVGIAVLMLGAVYRGLPGAAAVAPSRAARVA
jgi:hypothetical protein